MYAVNGLLQSGGGTAYDEILGIYDEKKTGELMGVPISKYREGKRDVPVVISLGDLKLAMDIEKNLRDAGYQDIYWYRENPYNDTLSGQLEPLGTWGEAVLHQAEMHISDACNLNCRGCTHFAPLFHSIDADMESRLEDVRTLSRKVSHIIEFDILGGEPFLNPDVGIYAEEIRKILPKTHINIVTNGLLLPRISKDVFDSLRRNEIVISISEYQPTHEIMDELTDRLEAFGVKYNVRPMAEKNIFNKPIELHPSGKYPLKCISNGCTTIYKGKICRCPTLMYAFKFNETFGAHLPTEGILNLDDAPEGEALLEKMKAPVPLCAHCVENLIPWGRCGGAPMVEDFAATD